VHDRLSALSGNRSIRRTGRLYIVVMSSRSGIAAVALASVLAATVCSDCSSASRQTPTNTDTARQVSSSASFPHDLASLTAALSKGAKAIGSAHVVVEQKLPSGTVTLTGDEQVKDGSVIAMDLVQVVNEQPVHLIVLADKVYLSTRSASGGSGTPWVLITARTRDPNLKKIYSSLVGTRQRAGGDAAKLLASAARGMRLIGTQALGGQTVAHYLLDVDPALLPDSFQGKSTLVGARVKSIQVNLLVDHAGVARSVVEKLQVQGQRILVTVSISRIGLPVHIAAPPPAQVRTAS
jgi:hypothetical protein